MSDELKQREWFVKGWNKTGTLHFDSHILGRNIADVREAIEAKFKGAFIYHISTKKPLGSEVAS